MKKNSTIIGWLMLMLLVLLSLSSDAQGHVEGFGDEVIMPGTSPSEIQIRCLESTPSFWVVPDTIIVSVHFDDRYCYITKEWLGNGVTKTATTLDVQVKRCREVWMPIEYGYMLIDIERGYYQGVINGDTDWEYLPTRLEHRG